MIMKIVRRIMVVEDEQIEHNIDKGDYYEESKKNANDDDDICRDVDNVDDAGVLLMVTKQGTCGEMFSREQLRVVGDGRWRDEVRLTKTTFGNPSSALLEAATALLDFSGGSSS